MKKTFVGLLNICEKQNAISMPYWFSFSVQKCFMYINWLQNIICRHSYMLTMAICTSTVFVYEKTFVDLLVICGILPLYSLSIYTAIFDIWTRRYNVVNNSLCKMCVKKCFVYINIIEYNILLQQRTFQRVYRLSYMLNITLSISTVY